MIERLPSPTKEASAELRAGGLTPIPWSAGPFAMFPPHQHERNKRLYVLSGSISFDGMELQPGDGILVPKGWTHSAVAGVDGVECVEAFEPVQ
jgi:mannose-6-phosphate isomerase-like protein (cupin superfamily)